MWLSYLLIGLVRMLVGATPRYAAISPTKKQAIYFANHSSHIDTVALWSALPPAQRSRTRPVAALDYWGRSRMRRYIALKGLNAVLIDRTHQTIQSDPLQPLSDALRQGDSLIIFPEGTRQTDPVPGAFKSGLYHLSQAFPEVELVPVYLENLHRSMPKGYSVPVPMICTVRFGLPIEHKISEKKEDFLNRARQAVIDLS